MENTIKDPITRAIKLILKVCKNDCENCIFGIKSDDDFDDCPVNFLDEFWGDYHGHFIDDFKE